MEGELIQIQEEHDREMLPVKQAIVAEVENMVS